MNKNFKILSSLAAAGIITVTGLTSAVSAATPNSLGVYRKVISGTIAPYVVATANDKVTVQDLKNDHGNITISLSNNEKVATGTTFRKNNEKHTVIIYGDVDGNGDINVNDVTTLAQGVVKGNLTEVKKEAGNVEHNNSTDVNDVTKLARFIVKGEKITVSLPSEEVPATEYAYTLQVNDNNVINSVNVATAGTAPNLTGGSKLLVTPAQNTSFKENDSFTLWVAKKGEDGKYATDAQITATIQGQPSDRYVEVEHIDFSSINGANTDGTYRMRLKQGSKVVAETEVEKHTDVTEIKANVIGRRASSRYAAVSVDGYGKSKITKIYCLVAGTSDNTITVAKVIEQGKALDITNNTLPLTLMKDKVIDTDTQTLYYVLEDSYGSQTALKTDVVLALDNVSAINDVNVKLIKADNDSNEFTIELDKALPTAADSLRNVIVTLYKDGVAIASETLDKDDFTAVAPFKATTTAFGTEIVKEAGNYTAKAYVTGTAKKQPSDVVESTGDNGTIKATKLAQVSNVRFNKETGVITWDDSNTDVTYDVKVAYPEYTNSKYTGKYITASKPSTIVNTISTQPVVNNERKEATFNVAQLDKNTSYAIQIIVRSTDNARKIDSDVYEKEIYVLDLNPVANQSLPGVGFTVAKKDENSVTFNVNPITIKGNEDVEPSYKIGVYEYNTTTQEDVLSTTKNVTLNEVKTDGVVTGHQIVVDGLAAKEYKFTLSVTVGDVTETTTLPNSTITTYKTKETITNASVIKGITDVRDIASTQISYTSGNTAYVNGKAIDLRDYDPEYAKIFTDVVANLENGDELTVTDDTITVKLGATLGATTTLGTSEKTESALKGKTLRIIGNDNWRTIAIAANSVASGAAEKNNEVEKVILEATNSNDGLFIVGSTALNAKEVVLNGVNITSATTSAPYTLAAGKTNIVNNVTVTATQDTEVKPAYVADTSNTFTIEPSTSALTFVNDAKLALNVTFDGNNTLKPQQSGKVTITSEGGNVTVSGTNAAVTGEIDVKKVANGTLDIQTANTLTGKQNVVVSNTKVNNVIQTTTVMAKLNEALPINLTNFVITSYKYDTAEDETAAKATLKSTNDGTNGKPNFAALSNADFEKVYNFLKGLNIDEAWDATVTTSKENKTITIVFNAASTVGVTATEEVNNYTVPGLQLGE